MSKHEQLFGPISICKDAKFVLLQLCATGIIICLTWALICFVGYTLTAAFIITNEHRTTQEIIELATAPFAHFLILMGCLSVTSRVVWRSLTTYCLITNTEMMKDRKALEEVVREQKVERSERNYRIFQAMRLIRREYIKMIYPDMSQMSGEDSFSDLDMFMGRKSKDSFDSIKVPEISHKRLKDITVKHILDNFKKIGKPSMCRQSTHSELNGANLKNSMRFSTAENASWAINIDDMHRMIRMCGGDLDKFESFYLLKRSNYGS